MIRSSRVTPIAVLSILLLAPAAFAQGQDGGRDGDTPPQQVASLDPSMVTTIDTTSLADTTGAVPHGPIGAMVIEAHAQALRPAPLPDQDFDAPGPSAQTLAAQEQASVTPGFYAPTSHFSGDGFASGSTLDGDQANRHRRSAEMSLSIPVQ